MERIFSTLYGKTCCEVGVFVIIAYIRSVILFIILIVAVRLMGKRQIGEMEPSEFVVTMIIANLATVPMQDSATPLLSGVIPILTILSLELLLSVLSMHSIWFRRVLCGKPEILIHNGEIDQNAMRNGRINADELSELLRQSGVTDLTAVQYAILETNGSLSILPYPKHEPASAKDAGIKVSKRELPITLISNGRLLKQNLPLARVDKAWVDRTLGERKLRLKDVYLLTLEPGGKLYLAEKAGQNH